MNEQMEIAKLNALVEQYKAYLEGMGRDIQRISTDEKLYTSLLLAILAGVGFVMKETAIPHKDYVLLTMSYVGIMIYANWHSGAVIGAQSIAAKGQVLGEIEQFLPADCLLRQATIMKESLKGISIWQIIRASRLTLMWTLSVPFWLLMIYSGWRIIASWFYAG
jgi:hypothetical protein